MDALRANVYAQLTHQNIESVKIYLRAVIDWKFTAAEDIGYSVAARPFPYTPVLQVLDGDGNQIDAGDENGPIYAVKPQFVYGKTEDGKFLNGTIQFEVPKLYAPSQWQREQMYAQADKQAVAAVKAAMAPFLSE